MVKPVPVEETPSEFAEALASAGRAVLRPELRVFDTPAPQGLAPFHKAWAADVEPSRVSDDREFGTGRLVLLFDPEKPEAWGSPFRMVVYAQAPIDTSMGSDEFLPNVAWSWLIDALDQRAAAYQGAAGTATTVLSTGFGQLAEEGQGAQIEVRASWSPLTSDLTPHMEAWFEFVCMLAGFPPSAEGVASISPPVS